MIGKHAARNSMAVKKGYVSAGINLHVSLVAIALNRIIVYMVIVLGRCEGHRDTVLALAPWGDC
jgi:hypothetical protein